MVNKTVVLIDDDIEDIEFFRDVIKSLFPKYSCSSFTDACGALEYLRTVTTRPDVIIIDLNLKDMAAEECIDELRKIALLDGAKTVVYSSAIPNIALLTRLEIAGVDFFQKPSSIKELERRVRQILL